MAFKDSGEYWDAWNIAPNYLEHPLPAATLVSIQWIAEGPVEQRLRVVRQLGQSIFRQDYVLHIDSPMLRVESVVDWRDRHIVVKAAFPFTVSSDHATYDMPFGAIERATAPSSSMDQAKWEVPGLAWADLTDSDPVNSYGVSILSDYKHGYSATPTELRLTLLRGPTWPDPEADQGLHTFCYAIYPHAGDWRAAQTVHHSHALRHPLRVVSAVSDSPTVQLSQSPLPSTSTLLDVSNNHFILTAMKPSETDPQTWILRGYECHGQPGSLALALGPWNDTHLRPELTSILEAPLASDEPFGSHSPNVLRPWGVQTWQLSHPRT